MFQPNSTVSITFRCYGCFKIACQIDEKIRVSQKLTLICAGNKRFPTDRGIKKGGKGSSHTRGEFTHTGGVHTHGVSRRVGKGFPTHGGISHPRGDGTHTGGCHTHGGSSHTRGDGTHTGGVLTHGGMAHTRGGVHSRVTWYKSPVVQSKLPKLFFKLHLALPTGPGGVVVCWGVCWGCLACGFGIFVLLLHGWHRCRCRLRGV